MVFVVSLMIPSLWSPKIYNSCYSLLLPLFSRSVLENDVFLGLLSDEANKEAADCRVVSLHLLLSHGHSPFSLARPTFSNRATQTIFKQVGVDINTGSVYQTIWTDMSSIC